MRVTSIELFAPISNQIVTLSYRDPTNQNSYNAKSVTGLDAEEITPKFYGSSSTSNDKYYDLSLKKREVVFQIGLNPNFSINQSYSNLRDALYKFIASSRTGSVQIRLKDGAITVAVISGFITKFDSPQFTKSPEVQLTISCTEPMLKAPESVLVNVAPLTPLLSTIIDDKSTSPHGFQFEVQFTAAIATFSIQDSATPAWKFEVDLTGSPLVQFAVGDKLQYSSEVNARHVRLLRGAVVTQLVDRITSTSIWPVMFPGSNTYIRSASNIWNSITYFPTYWGV